MSTTDIELSSKALVLIGADPITSFQDGSREAVVAANLYNEITRGEMSVYPWRFLVTQERANRVTEAPVGTEWGASYTVPASSLRIINVKVDGFPVKFDVFLNSLHTNTSPEEVVIVEYVKDVPESGWPHYFRNYIILRLSSVFASSLGRDGNLTTAMSQQAEFSKREARTSDSQGRTTKRLPRSQIVQTRFGGSGLLGADGGHG